MEIVYQDKRIVVAIKPVGVLSTDLEGGMPELFRDALHTDCIFGDATVFKLRGESFRG